MHLGSCRLSRKPSCSQEPPAAAGHLTEEGSCQFPLGRTIPLAHPISSPAPQHRAFQTGSCLPGHPAHANLAVGATAWPHRGRAVGAAGQALLEAPALPAGTAAGRGRLLADCKLRGPLGRSGCCFVLVPEMICCSSGGGFRSGGSGMGTPGAATPEPRPHLPALCKECRNGWRTAMSLAI